MIPQTTEPWQCTEVQLRKLPLEVSVPRRVACVNALQGIKDPKEAIPAAREALRSLIEKVESGGWTEIDVDQARQALAMLEGAYNLTPNPV